MEVLDFLCPQKIPLPCKIKTGSGRPKTEDRINEQKANGPFLPLKSVQTDFILCPEKCLIPLWANSSTCTCGVLFTPPTPIGHLACFTRPDTPRKPATAAFQPPPEATDPPSRQRLRSCYTASRSARAVDSEVQSAGCEVFQLSG